MSANVTPKVTATTIPAVATDLYTPQASFNGWVDAVTITNTHSSSVDVTIWRTTGGGASTSTTILKTYPLDTLTAYPIRELVAHWVLDGGSISGVASVAGVVAFNLSAREFAA